MINTYNFRKFCKANLERQLLEPLQWSVRSSRTCAFISLPYKGYLPFFNKNLLVDFLLPSLRGRLWQLWNFFRGIFWISSFRNKGLLWSFDYGLLKFPRMRNNFPPGKLYAYLMNCAELYSLLIRSKSRKRISSVCIWLFNQLKLLR